MLPAAIDALAPDAARRVAPRLGVIDALLPIFATLRGLPPQRRRWCEATQPRHICCRHDYICIRGWRAAFWGLRMSHYLDAYFHWLSLLISFTYFIYFIIYCCFLFSPCHISSPFFFFFFSSIFSLHFHFLVSMMLMPLRLSFSDDVSIYTLRWWYAAIYWCFRFTPLLPLITPIIIADAWCAFIFFIDAIRCRHFFSPCCRFRFHFRLRMILLLFLRCFRHDDFHADIFIFIFAFIIFIYLFAIDIIYFWLLPPLSMPFRLFSASFSPLYLYFIDADIYALSSASDYASRLPLRFSMLPAHVIRVTNNAAVYDMLPCLRYDTHATTPHSYAFRCRFRLLMPLFSFVITLIMLSWCYYAFSAISIRCFARRRWCHYAVAAFAATPLPLPLLIYARYMIFRHAAAFAADYCCFRRFRHRYYMLYLFRQRYATFSPLPDDFFFQPPLWFSSAAAATLMFRHHFARRLMPPSHFRFFAARAAAAPPMLFRAMSLCLPWRRHAAMPPRADAPCAACACARDGAARGAQRDDDDHEDGIPMSCR